MNLDLLLDVLARSGATVGVDRQGRLVALHLPADLAPATAHAAADLAWAVMGRGTGHRWARCTGCGRSQLVATGAGHGCRLTPRCPGQVKALTKPRDPPGLADGLLCARPGCGKPACHLTAGHEPVCHLDFVHLALRTENPPT